MESKDILNLVREKGIRFIYFWFTDILGILKSFAITDHELEKALEEGMGFDGSSVEGFTRIQESDMIAFPDNNTFKILPWKTNDSHIARVFCDILNPDGSPYMGDARHVLKKNLGKAEESGYSLYVGPELEYFYFPSSSDPTPLDKGGYFDLLPLDLAVDLRKETIKVLEALDIGVEYSHHEVAPSQHEIDLRYTDALSMADNVMTYKMVVKRVAHKNGYYATFMPKPIFGVNGSGMHIHQSLFKDGRNAFFDKDGPQFLSDTGRHYITGLLDYAREITSVTNQWVNSYKRLVAGYEAPVYICWGQKNRSALVRVPEYKPGKENATRVELRSPDPACNPYLAFSVMLAAGLAGINEARDLPEPRGDNIYTMTEGERREREIESLPEDLWEAIKLTEKSTLVKEALGDHIFEQFLRSKRITWETYRAQVTQYEIDTFLSIL
jgi:glutamine synthetase